MRRRAEPWSAFFIRRFFRIAPMFYAGVGFYLFWNGLGPRAETPDGMPVTAIPLTMLFLHGWRPDTINAVVPGGWSIAAEAMFYLMLPLAFLRVRRLSHAVTLFAVAWLVAVFFRIHPVIAALYSPWVAPKYDTLMYIFVNCWLPAQLPVFACGILLFFIVSHPSGRDIAALRWGALIVGGLIYVSGMKLLPSSIAFAVGATFAIWGLAQRSLPLLVNPALCFLGKISFSVCIVHFAILDWLAPRLLPLLPMSGLLQFTTLMAIVLLAAVPLSALTYFAIEVPGQNLGHRLNRRLFARPT